MRTLSQIFRIAQRFHAHHNIDTPNYGQSGFMCHALKDAMLARKLTIDEYKVGGVFADALARSVSSGSASLAGAVNIVTASSDHGMTHVRHLAAQVWDFTITELELKEKELRDMSRTGTKIRHYRNHNYDCIAEQFTPHNMGGATIVFRELAGGKVALGISLCIENFNRSIGERIARQRLDEKPVIVAAELLEDVRDMEDLYYSDLATALEVEYKSKGVHLSFYKAFHAGF